MIYGLYLSATGVMTSSHRIDVISNNLANSETSGFKRSLAHFRERPSEAVEDGEIGSTNSLLDQVGGGIWASPTRMDMSQGALERSDSPLHLALAGSGFFGIGGDEQTRLTRNGNFMLDRSGRLVLSDGSGSPVLDAKQQPIRLDPRWCKKSD